MEVLSSVQNPRVQRWRSLKDAKGREETGCFLVEGVRMVREALSSTFPLECILLREDTPCPDSIPPEIPVCVLSDRAFQAVSDTKTPQGIAAVLRRRDLPLSGRRLLALDRVQDPGNVGTILRTADAAGLEGILLGPDCADVFSPRVLRASMGSIFRMGLAFPASLPEELTRRKALGYSVLSSQLDGDPFFDRPSAGASFILVIGNEGAGVSDPVKALATHRLRLPMRGGAESLNAAVAAGIMMYDLMRKEGAL